ncbi:energy transducer TonB [Pseudoduganella plicata]|nr:energy transducer TonB [Pseudoduganella plicata]
MFRFDLRLLGIALLCGSFAGRTAFAQEAEHPTHQADRSARVNLPGCARPQYPRSALLLEAEGTVTLSYLIGADGTVKESRVFRSSGNAELDEAARIALAKCRFDPAVVDGQPVEAWTKMQYLWKLDARPMYSF